jgi:hypothetical protein
VIIATLFVAVIASIIRTKAEAKRGAAAKH